MKDYNIYIFNVWQKGNELTIAQVYSANYYMAFDTIVLLFPGYEDILCAGMEYTTMPCDWDYVTNESRLSN